MLAVIIPKGRSLLFSMLTMMLFRIERKVAPDQRLLTIYFITLVLGHVTAIVFPASTIPFITNTTSTEKYGIPLKPPFELDYPDTQTHLMFSVDWETPHYMPTDGLQHVINLFILSAQQNFSIYGRRALYPFPDGGKFEYERYKISIMCGNGVIRPTIQDLYAVGMVARRHMSSFIVRSRSRTPSTRYRAFQVATYRMGHIDVGHLLGTVNFGYVGVFDANVDDEQHLAESSGLPRLPVIA